MSYSTHIVERNKKADGKRLGVKLGRVCIKHNIPVSVVAKKLGVSRQSLYNWMCGTTSPQNLIKSKVEALLAFYS
jgi:transcriptional regulator with XRE-family HTH domain